MLYQAEGVSLPRSATECASIATKKVDRGIELEVVQATKIEVDRPKLAAAVASLLEKWN